MMKVKLPVVLAFAAALGGSGPWALALPTGAAPATSPAAMPAKVGSAMGQSPQHEGRISNEGIGPAKLGMTFGQLKAVLGRTVQFRAESQYMDGFDALAVLQAGAVQFRILHPAGRRLRDKDTLQTLVTENPTYQTAEGIGPGVALSRAEYVLGKVLLQYNEENESREDVSFAKQAQGRVSFTPGADGQAFAGIYSAGERGPAFSTGRYHPHAQIRLVWVTQ